MGSAIVALSGGIDSATVLWKALEESDVRLAVGFTYGSKHNIYEQKCAAKLAELAGVDYKLIDFSSVTESFNSALLKNSQAVPEGHYQDPSMSQTVVPGRNLIFISILAGLAWSKEVNEIWMGFHAGDYEIYPDCRPAFVKAMDQAVRVGTDSKVGIRVPYLYALKYQIIQNGIQMKVPYEHTRTCYKDQEIACGRCGSCQERLEAFDYCDTRDPIAYVQRDLIPKESK